MITPVTRSNGTRELEEPKKSALEIVSEALLEIEK